MPSGLVTSPPPLVPVGQVSCGLPALVSSLRSRPHLFGLSLRSALLCGEPETGRHRDADCCRLLYCSHPVRAVCWVAKPAPTGCPRYAVVTGSRRSPRHKAAGQPQAATAGADARPSSPSHGSGEQRCIAPRAVPLVGSKRLEHHRSPIVQVCLEREKRQLCQVGGHFVGFCPAEPN
jgi:hypothetical protein